MDTDAPDLLARADAALAEARRLRAALQAGRDRAERAADRMHRSMLEDARQQAAAVRSQRPRHSR